MVVDKHDKLFVTNDAATITRELEVIHPAARMLVAAAQLQEQQVKINSLLNIVTYFNTIFNICSLVTTQTLSLPSAVNCWCKQTASFVWAFILAKLLLDTLRREPRLWKSWKVRR